MGPPLVVAANVGLKDPLQVPSAEDEGPVQALGPKVPTHRSQNALAFGARIGVRTIPMPSERNTSSKERVNFESRSWIRNLGGPPSLLEGQGQVSGLLGDPRRVRIRCRSPQVDTSRPELDPYQHMERVGHRNWTRARTSDLVTSPAMLYALFYAIIRRVLRLSGISSNAEAEVLVLRHELAVLRRQIKRPKLRRRDKLFLSAMSRRLPRERWTEREVSSGSLPAAVPTALGAVF